ncbi:MAG: hypothetical protein JWQ14_2881 [Adhaeribacter sp.]|nr:hypothetical protein [Adhaeribacter sp.]
MNQDLFALENLIIQLQGAPIISFSYNQNILMLKVNTPVAAQLLPRTESVHVVIRGCHKLDYLSYTQLQQERIRQENPEIFFGNALQIQGIELRNRNSLERKVKEGFILYCNSYLHTIEAGELHFTCNGFEIYDQEFGKISYDNFIQAADKLNTST